MRTLLLIVIGLVLALLMLRVAAPRRRTLAAGFFTFGWLLVCLWNLNTGLSHGYTLAQELPIHVALWGVPVLCCWWWRRRSLTR